MASETPPLRSADSTAQTATSASASSGAHSCTVTVTAGAPGTAAGSAATASTATVSSAGDASSTASSSRLPAHRWRTSRQEPGDVRTAAAQPAATGRPVIAPRWASTSLPRSVPAATTAVAEQAAISCCSALAQATGA